MKLFLITLLVAYAAADVSHILPKSGDREAKILSLEQDVGQDGKFVVKYETENGISAHQHGELKNPGAENPIQHMAGEYAYTAPDGQQIRLSYNADENGYVPVGSHIPTPPPIPEAILRSLEYIRAHPPAPERR